MSERWGRYTIERPMSVGGMAEIHLAHMEGPGGFNKRVVLKRILPHLAQDAEFVARFLQEARVVATLDHPNVAAVYDVGEHHETYFFTMEYVQGLDLRKVIKLCRARGRTLQIGEVVAVGIGLTSGLHYAHDKAGPDGAPLGIVHRDVSPSNVLISREGVVKLVDFGIAKVATGLVASAAGRLRGKIPYMSPEQSQGETVDRRSDVFAVGLLIWELLAGRRAVADDNEIAMIKRVSQRPPPDVRTVRPDCPPELAEILSRALRLRADDRYASALVLQDAFEEFATRERLRTSTQILARLLAELSGTDATVPTEAPPDAPTATYGPSQLGVVVRPPDPPPRLPRWALLAGAVVLAAGVVAAVALPSEPPAAPPAAPAAKQAATQAAEPPVVPIPAPAQPERSELPQPVVDPPAPAPKRKARRRRKQPRRAAKDKRRRAPSKSDLDAPLPPDFRP